MSSTIFETTADVRTFEAISKAVYGTEEYADLIKATNGTFKDSDQIKIGASIVVPDKQEAKGQRVLSTAPALAPRSVDAGSDDGSNQVQISISGKVFEFWESVSIQRSLSTIDGVTFQAPFDPEDSNFREIFRPFEFRDVDIRVGGALLFSGTMVNIDPIYEMDRRFVSVSCYSRPGVLMDCSLPKGAFPKNEINKQKLTGIAASVTSYFGLGYEFKDDPGPVFDRVAIPPESRVFDFLTTLAKQRGLAISSNRGGDLVFQKGKTEGGSVAFIQEGDPLISSVKSSFLPQDYFSEITAISPTGIGVDGKGSTKKNERARVFRPNAFKSRDAKGVDSKQSADAEMGRMFGNVAVYTVSLSTWRDPSGKLWEPNTLISLLYPSAMIYQKSQFLIRSVTMDQTSRTETAVLELALPSSFSETIPSELPWEG